jgi:diadenosine tetraphosphate (Ap4A) HIT family hydrolase
MDTMAEDLRITNGRIARSGFFRGMADPAAKQYAEKVATGAVDLDCVFCPEAIGRRRAEIVDTIGAKALGLVQLDHFYVIQANPAYAHFEAQRVVDHKLIIPYEHVESEHDLPWRLRRKLGQYVHRAELAAEEGTSVQRFTRSANNPSKSVGHLHTHLLTLSLDPVKRFSYDINEGVTDLEFVEVTPEQRDQIIDTRRLDI